MIHNNQSENNIEAFPLHWPVGKKRTLKPEIARFGDHSRAKAIKELLSELHALGARNILVSSNLKLRNDGLPYSNQRRPDDEGIAVYFDLNGSNKCFAVDRWNRTEHNIWAIAKSISALRGLERWGAKEMVDAAFRGFEALPSPEIVNPFFGLNRFELKQKIKQYHPDTGDGNIELYQLALNQLRSSNS